MNKALFKIAISTCIALVSALATMAQDGSAKPSEQEEEQEGKVTFNGLGRTNILQTGIDGNLIEGDGITPRDTLTPRGLTDGEFLLDLQINAQPNDKTEVQSILRLRNEFGGFFGAGMTIEVRELWARGVIANAVKYRVGDMDIEMSPYTLFMSQEEGTINEPSIFRPQKELIYYEQFYGDGNSRRMQGAHLDFGLKFTEVLRTADFKGFIARVRGTDFFTIPTRFVTGGEAQFSTVKLSEELGTKLDFGVNFVHTFDDLKSGEANSGIRNTVTSFNGDLRVMNNSDYSLHVLGEGGFSQLRAKEDSVTTFTSEDFFIDIGAKLKLKEKKLSVQANFVDVGPDFFSIGAQSKRVQFDAQKKYYNRAGASQNVRQATLFDLSRDPALYTFELSENLMPYDPRFSNTFPYGKATPNRRGVTANAEYGDENSNVEARVDGAFMTEIQGQGTEELKNFALAKAAATVHINKMINWQNGLRFTLGYQFEQTSRGGTDIESVDLNSNLLELGLEVELFKDFEFLLGTKYLAAEGSDYIPQLERFNVVEDFPRRTLVDDEEILLATGVRYNFKKGIYITLQYHSFAANRGVDNLPGYQLDQVFVLYTMNF